MFQVKTYLFSVPLLDSIPKSAFGTCLAGTGDCRLPRLLNKRVSKKMVAQQITELGRNVHSQ
jgi:hypothetical protein